MEYKVFLNNGQVMNLKNTQINSNEFTETLNSQSVLFVNIGDAVINKHLLQAIFPIDTEVVSEEE